MKAALMLLFLSSWASADAIANLATAGTAYRSASGAAEAVLGAGGAFFTVLLEKKKKYQSAPSEPALPLGRLFVSNDGRRVVWMLSSHFYGNRTPDLPALIFYVDGAPVKRYRLAELLVRPSLISMSTSHYQWIPERRNPNWSPAPDPVVFSPDGNRLELETTSFRRYVFDPGTGATLVAEDTPIYRKAELIVWGKMERRDGLLTMSDPRAIKGRLEPGRPLAFSDPTGSYTADWHAAALVRDANGWKTVAAAFELPVIYNCLDLAPYDSIGEATMDADGTIHLQLRAQSGGALGDVRLDYPLSHPKYAEILKHVGDLKPGRSLPVPPWPEDGSSKRRQR